MSVMLIVKFSRRIPLQRVKAKINYETYRIVPRSETETHQITPQL